MATKKFLELKEFSDQDLVNEIAETQTQLQKLEFDHAIKGLDNPLVLREVRRDIARLKTEVSRRRVEALDEAGKAKRSRIRKRRSKK